MEESYYESILRVFTKGLTARDIAEPLVSFDSTTPAETALIVMKEKNYDAVGVRERGAVAGYMVARDTGAGLCGEYLQLFDQAIVLPDSTPMAELIRALNRQPRVFIKFLGAVGGIVTPADLQDPPVRMWLFGLITLAEMRFKELIEKRFPGGDWHEYISDARLAKAKSIQVERQRRNQDPSLLDCLQFSDKGQIVVRDKILREQIGFLSRKRGEQTIKGLERLRNNLAHSQDIVSLDWDVVLPLAENLESVIDTLVGRRSNQ